MSLICPYNPSHKVGKKRFDIHKMTCPNRPQESQTLIKPMTSNNIQGIRSDYLKPFGGIPPPNRVIPGDAQPQSKQKRKDFLAQMNVISMTSKESIESQNYSDLLGKELEALSLSNFKADDMSMKNPLSVSSQIEFNGNHHDDDYDPNREDAFIHKFNKNMIDVSLIAKYSPSCDLQEQTIDSNVESVSN